MQSFPLPLIEEYAQGVCFLPLVLRLVNEESAICRKMIANDCLGVIFQRVSVQKMAILWDYSQKWFSYGNELPLRRTAAQLFGLVIDHRPNFVQRDRANNLFDSFASTINNLNKDICINKGYCNGDADWEFSYFCLVSFEKLYKICQGNEHNISVWTSILKSVVHSHPWVSLVASRIIYLHLSMFRPIDLIARAQESKRSSCFVTVIPGSLYEIARNICYLFNASNDIILKQEFVALTAKALSWVLEAMYYHSNLCFKDSIIINFAEEDEQENYSTSTVSTNKIKNRSIHWVLVRLSGIAGKENSRREAVFKCFAAFAQNCNDIISPYLRIILEPVNRCILDDEHKQKQQNNPLTESSCDDKIVELAKDLLQLLEEKCDTQQFLQSYAVVKTNATEKRVLRKQSLAAKAITDSKSYSEEKIKKQASEKKRKKRRLDEKKQMKTLL